MSNKFNFPHLGFGAGLRTTHYPDIVDKWPTMDWFEIISENFMDTGGKPIRMLEKIREHYPIVMHGVSMSIGSTDPLDKDYLTKLKKLADWLDPPWISDHVCWTGVDQHNTHDLLPVPYTEESLQHIVSRIKQVQDFIERPLVLENPSTYMEFQASTMSEWEFIAHMAQEANCGLLLDVNNVYVTCYNHQLDPKTYIDALPEQHIVQIHLAGHDNQGTHIVDTHDNHVIDEVWQLFSYSYQKLGGVSSMVEWDGNIPEFAVLKAEIAKCQEYVKSDNQLPTFDASQRLEVDASRQPEFNRLYERMQSSILEGKGAKETEWIIDKKGFPADQQLSVYINGYRYRLFDIVSDEFPVLRHYLGDDLLDAIIRGYIELIPSKHFNITHFIDLFPDFIQEGGNEIRERGYDPVIAYEIAQLEFALSHYFDAEETKPLAQEDLKALDLENFIEMTLPLRKAHKLLSFTHDINDYYRSVMEEGGLITPITQPQWLVIFRHEDVMYRMELDKIEYTLLNVFSKEKTVGEALSHVFDETDVDEAELMANLQSWFSNWITSGLLAKSKG